MSKSLLLVFAGILVALVSPLAAARGQGNSQPAAPAQASAMPSASTTLQQNPITPTAVSQARAKEIYQIDCAVCHGDTGNGKTDLATSMELTLPDWTDPKVLAGRPDKDLFEIIRKGKDKMPPEDGTRAKDSEVWSLVTYIRNMSKGQPTAPSTAAK